MDELERYEVTLRVSIRRVSDGRKIHPDGVASFDVPSAVKPSAFCEVAVEAIRLRALGAGGPAALAARAKVAARDFARRPEVKRSVAVLAALLRNGADRVEHEAAKAAARIVHQPAGVDVDTGGNR